MWPGCPGRHEITTGELNYQHIFQALKEMGYPGYVGLEYFTDNPIEPGLEGGQEAVCLLIHWNSLENTRGGHRPVTNHF